MTYLTLAIYALLILVATIAGDRLGPSMKLRMYYLANEIRWRLCKLWHTQIKPVLSCVLSRVLSLSKGLSKGVIEGWRLGR